MSGCPGSRMMSFGEKEEAGTAGGKVPSRLRQWPVQLHLVSPQAPYYQGADLLLAADCTAFALGGFHEEYLKGKSLAILCPKLDSEQEIYVEKIRALVEESGIKSLTVAIMQVPCCRGVLGLVARALEGCSRKVPVRAVVVGLQGEVLQDGPIG
ncbi:MAG: iron-sulfur cluster-binding protein [Deltaproteobacteria bacterium]|nr:iron-sulfur cluster-binding protein [Deltaproteobacteria bacterium]